VSLRVAPDACVLIGAVRSRLRDPAWAVGHHSNAFLTLAESRAFTLVLYDLVHEQVKAVLKHAENHELEKRLTLCDTQYVRTDPELILDALDVNPKIRPAIRHPLDYAIGAALHLDAPDYFVSENERHFNTKLEDCLAATQIKTPRQFLANPPFD
jgi:hypothetical protein